MTMDSNKGKINDPSTLAGERFARAIVYSRVSTDAQERDGTSLDTQERESLEHIKFNGWQVIECIRDTASGYTLERSGGGFVRDGANQRAFVTFCPFCPFCQRVERQ